MISVLKLSLLVLLLGLANAAAGPDQEINGLLKFVKELEGATFVRNGKPHTPVEAESHLRMKWEKQKDKIGTAEKFIELCATKSYLSGKKYTIRLKDGSEKESAVFLRKKLAALRNKK